MLKLLIVAWASFSAAFAFSSQDLRTDNLKSCGKKQQSSIMVPQDLTGTYEAQVDGTTYTMEIADDGVVSGTLLVPTMTEQNPYPIEKICFSQVVETKTDDGVTTTTLDARFQQDRRDRGRFLGGFEKYKGEMALRYNSQTGAYEMGVNYDQSSGQVWFTKELSGQDNLLTFFLHYYPATKIN